MNTIEIWNLAWAFAAAVFYGMQTVFGKEKASKHAKQTGVGLVKGLVWLLVGLVKLLILAVTIFCKAVGLLLRAFPEPKHKLISEPA